MLGTLDHPLTEIPAFRTPWPVPRAQRESCAQISCMVRRWFAPNHLTSPDRAEALHPDKVQVEEEKERRTEAMKESTRAYQDGDLARLLELERTWMVGGELSSASEESDELERRLATLERTNEALRAQLDQLTGELKELRRSPQAELWSQAERAAKGSGVTPVEWMVQDASVQLEHLRELVGFITSFRDGQIDLDACARDHWTWRLVARVSDRYEKVRTPPDVRILTRPSRKLSESLERMLALPIEQILVAHSDPITNQPAQQLAEAWRFAIC
jgi:predicted RNase H-like nuclease (RuvC/YqgF family)